MTVAPIAPGAEWVRPADCRTRYGISRSLAYELMASGEIESVSLRRKGRLTGIRLINADSLRAYIASHREQASH